MISSLSINNYALIRKATVNLNPGFTTITGETGAGKSILIGALSLVLGDRADVQSLHDKNKKCIVEGEFDLSSYQLEHFFEENNLDYHVLTILRREINSNGRSRAFINDTPVTLSQLKTLGIQLFDIHSQHQTLLLNSKGFQLKIVDAYCDHLELLNNYKKTHKSFLFKKKELEELKNKDATLKSEFEYQKYLLQELEDANLVAGNELEAVEDELKILEHSEEIQHKLKESLSISDENDSSIVPQLNLLQNLLSSISGHSNDLNTVSDRVKSILLEVKDCVAELYALEDNLVHDPQRTDSLKERQSLLYQLIKKHSLASSDELLSLQSELEEKLNNSFEIEDLITDLENETDDLFKSAFKLAKDISSNRNQKIPIIQSEIQSTLKSLGMPNNKIVISNNPLEELNSDGLDDLVFYFSANKGAEPIEIGKVASGGELSRIMLSIKYLIASKINLPSILFDEIDSGVSGEIAHKMGELMHFMSKQDIQVISITHLPQVAVLGKSHLLVSKHEVNGFTETQIKSLEDEERVNEVAKMLSGKEITPITISNARELLSN
jgi:DNA repair protein RecN (Recombination protein N)